MLRTWNVAGVTNSARELDVAHITSGVDVLFLTEAELPAEDSFSVPGFITFYPTIAPSNTYRLLALVDEVLASQTNVSVILTSHLYMWLRLDIGSTETLAIGGVYRQWSSDEEGDLAQIHENAAAMAATYKHCALIGDFNLDSSRLNDKTYSRRK